MIKPTVGRVVWFTPSCAPNGFNGPDFLTIGKHGDQPCAAMVTYVWNDRMVNLVVFDHYGKPFNKTSVLLLQDDDAEPEHGYFCSWMPYQVGQAAKHAGPGAIAGNSDSYGFGQYRRKQIAELRAYKEGEDMAGVSVSPEDVKAGSPKAGDMIARNPKNRADKWLVAAAYFADNFAPL